MERILIRSCEQRVWLRNRCSVGTLLSTWKFHYRRKKRLAEPVKQGKGVRIDDRIREDRRMIPDGEIVFQAPHTMSPLLQVLTAKNMDFWHIIVGGVITQLFYRKYEPRSPLLCFAVLSSAPLFLVLLSTPIHFLTFKAVVKAHAVYQLSLTCSIVGYRLSPFHPLAGFPGPTINKVSQLWNVYIQSTGKQYLALKQMHDQYGPIVRIGPNELSIIDVDAGLAVLGQNGLIKGRYYDARRDPKAPGNLFALVGHKHTERRRLWQRAFTSDSLSELEVPLKKRISGLMDGISRASKHDAQSGGVGQVDLSKWFSWFSVDFMGDLCFGGGFELMQAGADTNGIRGMFERFSIALSMLAYVPWAAPLLMKLPFLVKHVIKFRQFAVHASSNRIRRGSSVKDLWYYLSDEANLEPVPPPKADVIADGALAMVAGSDTAAAGLSSLFYLLLSHPDKYRYLQAEIDAVYPKDEDEHAAMDSSRHGRLVYLNACLNEALRLFPPTLTSGPREVVRGSGGRVISGRFIPEGTQIYVPPYSMHRNPANFSPRTDEFVPERWLSTHSDVDKSGKRNFVHNSHAFIPFSYGPANCVGRPLARRQLVMTTVALLRRFELTFAPGYEEEGSEVGSEDHRKLARWERDLCDYFISTKGPLRVVLRERT